MSESTTPPPEIWDNILKGNVKKDDPFWNEYLDKAAVFDVRMVDEWNKTVDVLLVYVGLLISVLTSFIANTSKFERNPADITNDLLVAIYNQLATQSKNISITPVDPASYFNLSKDDYHVAVVQNALLYVSLSLSIVVSLIGLAAKLWLVNYSRQVFSSGSPYERAMKRQEAYNGVLVWRMGGVINTLPLILLIALYMFGYCVYTMVSADQKAIGAAVGVFLGVGLMFLVLTSFNAACIPGCPFRSPFSEVIRSFFEKVGILIMREIRQRRRPTIRMWIECFMLLAAGLFTFLKTYNIRFTSFPMFSLVSGIPILVVAQRKVVHKPQKYKISRLAAWVCPFISLPVIIVIYLSDEGIKSTATQVALLLIGFAGIVITLWMFSKMSKSMADTGKIDAISWLLITTPPQYPSTFFKKAGQMTGVDSIGHHYRPRLLKSLLPLLTPLITSYHTPEHLSSDTHSPQSNDASNRRPRTRVGFKDDDMITIDENPHLKDLKDLEIYMACLARLSDFQDYKGAWSCVWEDAKKHPELEELLIDKLVELANSERHSQVVTSAATKVLNNYKLDMQGKPLRSPTVLESVATYPRSETTSMLNDNDLNRQERGHIESYRLEDLATHVKPVHSSEETEEVRREIGGEEVEEVRDNEIGELRREIGDEKIEENPLESPTTILENVATDSRGETTLMLKTVGRIVKDGDSELYRPVDRASGATCEDLATHIKPAHSSEEEIEEVKLVRREIGDE